MKAILLKIIAAVKTLRMSKKTHTAVIQSHRVWYKQGAKNPYRMKHPAWLGLPISCISDGLAGSA